MKLISHLNQNVRFIQAQALTSKSLKTNNLGGFMEFGELIEHEGAGVVCGCDTGRVIASFSYEYEADKFVEAHNAMLSDLEIVQKALNVRGHHKVIIYNDGSWSVELKGPWGDDFESLLTWAKQTIGVE